MSKKTESYVHKEKKRKNNPEVGLSVYDKDLSKKSKFDYDPHLDPQLIWTNKSEKTSFEVPIVSLLIQEKINPKRIINKYLRDMKYQSTLDNFFDKKIPLDKKIEFYQHDIDWTNRLFLGDSLLVMNSLINKEGMTGKIQMIFIDPPYGIGYNSNFQVEIESKKVKDGDDDSLTREPEQIKAFRDTWELGIHSYLPYLRDRLILAKILLNESGSCFVQISDKNLHHVREIMDEIFGERNYVVLIPFRTATTQRSKHIGSVYDYLVWYAKDISQMKYHKLYHERSLYEKTKTFNYIKLNDGSIRTLGEVEKSNPEILSKGKLFKPSELKLSKKDQQNYKKRMENLEKLNRIYTTSKGTKHYIRYEEDFPYLAYINVWDDTVKSTFSEPDIYVTQTSTKVLKRCILMTTDPGDLVFDTTCGSGTTAYVAEKWGRRWITCDTSRIAINLAKQRIITSFFEYFKVIEGKNFDFKYTKSPHITKTIIADNKEIEYEIIYDTPEIDNEIIRVSGPFTYETISSSQLMLTIEDALKDENEDFDEINSFIEKVLLYLKYDGLSYPNNQKIKLKEIQPYKKGFIHARALIENEKEETVAISIGPEFGDVNLTQVERAIWDSLHGRFDWLIIVGFNFDESAQIKLKYDKPEQLKCEMAFINPDIEIEDLQKKPSGVQIFTVFGQPEIKLIEKEELYQIELIAIDIYNPQTGFIESVEPSKINVWFLDENFDNQTFFIHQLIFPNLNNKTERIKKILKDLVEESKIKYLTGTKSLPFKSGSHKKAAIKIVDYRGNEILSIIEFN